MSDQAQERFELTGGRGGDGGGCSHTKSRRHKESKTLRNFASWCELNATSSHDMKRPRPLRALDVSPRPGLFPQSSHVSRPGQFVARTFRRPYFPAQSPHSVLLLRIFREDDTPGAADLSLQSAASPCVAGTVDRLFQRRVLHPFSPQTAKLNNDFVLMKISNLVEDVDFRSRSQSTQCCIHGVPFNSRSAIRLTCTARTWLTVAVSGHRAEFTPELSAWHSGSIQTESVVRACHQPDVANGQRVIFGNSGFPVRCPCSLLPLSLQSRPARHRRTADDADTGDSDSAATHAEALQGGRRT